MITRIQAVHFDASQQLQEFVEKKVSKLEKLFDEAATLEVTMKLIKPETSMNKEVSLSLAGGGESPAAGIKGNGPWRRTASRKG